VKAVSLPKTRSIDDLTPEEREAFEERVIRFGDLAACDMLVDDQNRLVQVLIDNALPDDDVVLIQTNTEKACKAIADAVAGNVLQIGGNVKFFDGK